MIAEYDIFGSKKFIRNDQRCVFLEDFGLLDANKANENIEEVTYRIYNNFLNQINKTNLKYEIIRMWNVIPQINLFDSNIENYQRFCRARLKAFTSKSIEIFPAASAVGSKSNFYYFSIFAVATDLKSKTKEPVIRVTNPLQIEAFKYPHLYGPISPSFSRASVFNGQLYISGTASIRGHETVHKENITEQTLCTLENIEALILSAEKASNRKFNTNKSQWRIYLRDLKNQDQVSKIMKDDNKILFDKLQFVEADICRSDLDVEIEGVVDGI